jgi:hypothetical protein
MRPNVVNANLVRVGFSNNHIYVDSKVGVLLVEPVDTRTEGFSEIFP